MSYDVHGHDGENCGVEEHPSCTGMPFEVGCDGEGTLVDHDCTHDGASMMMGNSPEALRGNASMDAARPGRRGVTLLVTGLTNAQRDAKQIRSTLDDTQAERTVELQYATTQQRADAAFLVRLHETADRIMIAEIEEYLRQNPPTDEDSSHMLGPEKGARSRSLLQTHIHVGPACPPSSHDKGCRETGNLLRCVPLEGGPEDFYRCSHIAQPHTEAERQRIRRAIAAFKERHP